MQITLTGTGGELCVGNISARAYAYWLAQPGQDLEAHLFWDAEAGDHPDDVRLGPWETIDNLGHVFGAEVATAIIEVQTDDGRQLFYADLRSGVMPVGARLSMRDIAAATSPEQGCFIGYNRDGGRFQCISVPGDVFTPEKLSIEVTSAEIAGLMIVRIGYDDPDASDDGADTIGKGRWYRMIAPAVQNLG